MLSGIITIASTAAGYLDGGSDSVEVSLRGVTAAQVRHVYQFPEPRASIDALIREQFAASSAAKLIGNPEMIAWMASGAGKWPGTGDLVAKNAPREVNLNAEVWRWVNLYGVSNGGTPAPDVPQQQRTAGDALREIGGNLLDAVGDTATATVRSGLEGGVASSRGAATGARVGGDLFSSAGTILLVLAVAFLAYKAFTK